MAAANFVMAANPNYLDLFLDPLAELLLRPDVTDVFVNRPGEAWTETLDGALERHELPTLTEACLLRLARQVAALTNQGISRTHPLLSAKLPDGTRVQFIIPPATRGDIAIAMRKQVSPKLTLADYDHAGAFDNVQSVDDLAQADNDLRVEYQAERWSQFLSLAVRARKTILISGGTSSGKTTFLNALLREIDIAERLIFIEDTPEVVFSHPNAFGLVAPRGETGEAEITTDDLLNASLRMRPDRIILGEVRGKEAFTFLRAVNTGHPGSMTTIHADSPERALDQLALLAISGSSLRRDEVIDYGRSVIDIIVQLGRGAGRRRVKAIQWA